MLIKSMSRKQPSFAQLLMYFDKERRHGDERFTPNCYARPDDREGLTAELEHNATFLPKRANGNYLYHEFISLEPGLEVSTEKQSRILFDLVRQYLQRRAPHQLAVFKLHHETNHLHAHICISANDARGKTRRWLSKASLARIQREVEAYKLEHYPELGQRRLYARDARERDAARTEPRITTREGALKQRTHEPSRKEHDQAVLRGVFGTALSERDLQQALQQTGFELYRRGQTEGVKRLEDGRKYRLATLGLTQDLHRAEQRVRVFETRRQELQARQAVDRNLIRQRDRHE